jgi:hypothetical protein
VTLDLSVFVSCLLFLVAYKIADRYLTAVEDRKAMQDPGEVQPLLRPPGCIARTESSNPANGRCSN